MNETPVSLIPRWYERIWAWINPPLRAVLQISIILAALTFLQSQEPLIDRRIDHQDKVLSIARAGFSPVKIAIYAISFEINLIVDEANHVSLNVQDPIKAVSTRGFILEKTLWAPWSSQVVFNLRSNNRLEFEDWSAGEISKSEHLYCLAIETRNLLSNRFTVDTVLTPKRMFSASLFGPMSRSSALGGGYPKALLTIEAQIKSDCRALYDKAR